MVGPCSCTASIESAIQIRNLVDVGSMDIEQVSAERALILKIERRINITVGCPRYGCWVGHEIYPIGSHFKVVIAPGLLPRKAPVWRDAADVVMKARSRNGHSATRMLRSINSHVRIQVTGPQTVSSQARNIRAKRAGDDRRGDGGNGGT